MIRSAIGAELQSLIDYLNAHYPTEKDAILVVLPGYDCVEGPDGERGWACYDPDECVIWVPGEMPQIDEMSDDEIRRAYYEHVVHEFVHHVQNCEGRGFNEDEAETRAQEIVQAWLDEFALLDGERGGGGSESHTTRYLLHSSEYSTWACDADDCDALWYLEDGTPSENRMRYCPGCGRRIVAEVRDVEEQEAEDGEDDE